MKKPSISELSLTEKIAQLLMVSQGHLELLHQSTKQPDPTGVGHRFWTLAIVLVLLCLASSLSIPKNGVGTGTQVDTEMRQQIEKTMAPSDYQMPAAEAE